MLYRPAEPRVAVFVCQRSGGRSGAPGEQEGVLSLVLVGVDLESAGGGWSQVADMCQEGEGRDNMSISLGLDMVDGMAEASVLAYRT